MHCYKVAVSFWFEVRCFVAGLVAAFEAKCSAVEVEYFAVEVECFVEGGCFVGLIAGADSARLVCHPET